MCTVCSTVVDFSIICAQQLTGYMLWEQHSNIRPLVLFILLTGVRAEVECLTTTMRSHRSISCPKMRSAGSNRNPLPGSNAATSMSLRTPKKNPAGNFKLAHMLQSALDLQLGSCF